MKKLILIIFLFSISTSSDAQLSFPNGHELNLITGLDYLYFETEILFYTGKNKVENYRWEKTSNSIEFKWDISSCFNGECYTGLPEYGSFISDFGANDTTAFIRFHVWCRNIDDSIAITYRIYNSKDSDDQEELTFRITYIGTIGIDQPLNNDQLTFSLHSEGTSLIINTPFLTEINSVKLFDIHGKTLHESSGLQDEIDITNLPKGVYLIQLSSAANISTKRFIKN